MSVPKAQRDTWMTTMKFKWNLNSEKKRQSEWRNFVFNFQWKFCVFFLVDKMKMSIQSSRERIKMHFTSMSLNLGALWLNGSDILCFRDKQHHHRQQQQQQQYENVLLGSISNGRFVFSQHHHCHGKKLIIIHSQHASPIYIYFCPDKTT